MNLYVLREKKIVFYNVIYLNSLYLDRIFIKMINDLKINEYLNKKNLSAFLQIINYDFLI